MTVSYELFVANQPPQQLTVASNVSLAEGQTLNLVASASDLDSLSYRWDVDGDGSLTTV